MEIMRTAAILLAGSLTHHAIEPLAGGESAYALSLAFAKSLPGLAGGLVLGGGQALPPGPFPVKTRQSWSVEDILAEAEALCSRLSGEAGGPIEALALMVADEPFLDPGLAARLLEDYRRYRADYAFADGYPLGLAIEVLHPRVLPALSLLAGKNPIKPERGWLFQLIQKDINSFDIETLISPKDLRELRLVLACDSKRNKVLVERLHEAGVKDAATALDIIPRRLELLRTLPAFVQVQVSGACPQACALCPYPRFGGDILSRRDFLPRQAFKAMAGAIEAFAGDAVLDISLWGEPSLHPDIEGLVTDALSFPSLSLIVETSGIGWRPGVLESLSRAFPERLHWVVSLDSPEPELYRQLRGEGFEEAKATALLLLELFPKTAYVQTLRSMEGEAALEDFWRGWKKRTDNVIVQKYSTFAGFLPQRKVTDLSPLQRRPCWHLKRDMSILMDGSVPLCRECVRGEMVLGRLFEAGEAEKLEASVILPRLAAAWEAGEEAHRLHVAKDYPGPCKDCDEYYTYNA
jgi:spiro-SPASM protein